MPSTNTDRHPSMPAGSFRLLGKSYVNPFLKRTLTTTAGRNVQVHEPFPKPADPADWPKTGFYPIEAVIGERVVDNGMTQFCVAWRGDWPEDVKCEWLNASDCLLVDVLEYKAEMASLEDAAEGVPVDEDIIGARGKRAFKATRERIALKPWESSFIKKSYTRGERTKRNSDLTKKTLRCGINVFAKDVADTLHLETNVLSAVLEDSDEDAEFEEISMEEWQSLEPTRAEIS